LRSGAALVSYAPYWSSLINICTFCAHIWNQIGEWVMGRGDRKTRKGKRAIRSYGNVRPHNAMTTPTGPVVKKAAPAKAAVKKAAPAARKAAPRKAT
jgi:ribosomal small subunit protein bTHX